MLPIFVLLFSSLAPQAWCNPVQVVDLSGTWDFNPSQGGPTTIQVPGGGWKKQGFDVAEADYETVVSVPSIGQPQVTKLKFGAVNYQADLYINENFVASSTQSHTPAVFDITDYVTPGLSYTVRVHVKGHDALMFNGRSLVPNGAGSWSQTLPDGIFRSAELLVYPQIHIEDVFVRTYVSDTSLYYDVWLRNDSPSSALVTLSGSLDSWNGDPWGYPSLPSQQYSLPADSVTKVTIGPVNWNLGTGSYWWPNVPYQSGYEAQLHNLNLSLTGAASHNTTMRFGFRECTQEPDGQGNTCYFLNGVRVNFRGDSLQGANYDRIDTNGGQSGGQGNAYDTYPGFLEGPNGWRQAVDNYQRLNLNVVRIHQIPASPFMLDVTDELGLMIIDETGIRGAGDQQDFSAGWDNMVNHVKQLFTRDRNHPSVVRLSQSNEPDHGSTDSIAFQDALYQAAMEVDGTRPISIDAAWYDYHPTSPNGGLGYPNFNAILHYGWNNSQWGRYTDEVFDRWSGRPYGSGEHIWHHDNTKFGFTWWGTSTEAMRAKGASDIRPYTLLSGWASVIPGVSTSEMQLEEPPWWPDPLFPLYGEDNLPDPWNNYQIQRIQAGFSPVLVADAEYWDWNKTSNPNGDWPAYAQILQPSSQVTRVLNIFNDTFSGGTAVDVIWELRQGSATGPILDSGVINANVPYGYVANENLTFTTPNAPEGTKLYLVMAAEKGGVEMFREDKQFFVLSSVTPYPLVNPGFEQPDAGKLIGFNGQGPDPDVPGWVEYGQITDSGIEDPGSPAHSGKYHAFLKGRNSGEGGIYQMTGYTIQPGDVITVGYWGKIVAEGDPGWIAMTIVLFWNQPDNSNFEIGWQEAWPLTDSWQYYEFTVDADSVPNCIGGELGLQFVNTAWDWGGLDDVVLYINATPADSTPPAAPTGLTALPGNSSVSLDWANNTESDLNSYNVYRSTTSGGSYSQIASSVGSSDYTDNTVNNGTTYYYVVTAVDDSGNESSNSSEVSATPQGSGGPGDNYATAETTVSGSVSGNYAATYASDDSYESFTEEVSSGKPSSRQSFLEHVWQINIGSSGNPVLYVEAYHTSNNEGDDFAFGYSTDNVNFTDVLTVTKTSDNDSAQSVALPGSLTGTVYIRVVDTDQTPGSASPDTVYVDELYIHTSGGGGDTTPPAAPTGLSATAGDGSVALDWNDNVEPDLDSYTVYRSTTSGGGYSAIASGLGSSAYTDNTVNNSTTYYYVVTATDTSSNESGFSSQVSATPQSSGDPNQMHVSAITVQTVNAGQGNKRGQALVTILDGTGAPVQGATVTGTFSGDFNETQVGTTSASGVATLTTDGLKKGGVSFTFCVDDVSEGSHTYDPGSNVLTCNSL